MAELVNLKAAKEYVRERAKEVITIQRRPFTFTEVRVSVSTESVTPCVIGVGFSKVMWPDQFDPKRGKAIALGKAEVDAARQLLARGDGEHGNH